MLQLWTSILTYLVLLITKTKEVYIFVYTPSETPSTSW